MIRKRLFGGKKEEHYKTEAIQFEAFKTRMEVTQYIFLSSKKIREEMIYIVLPRKEGTEVAGDFITTLGGLTDDSFYTSHQFEKESSNSKRKSVKSSVIRTSNYSKS
jgi:hypothetical protein